MDALLEIADRPEKQTDCCRPAAVRVLRSFSINIFFYILHYDAKSKLFLLLFFLTVSRNILAHIHSLLKSVTRCDVCSCQYVQQMVSLA